MESIDRNKKLIIIAFILSLLFHASFILYFLLLKTNNSTSIPTQQAEEELKRTVQTNEPWAETKAQAGNFGAPVFFKDKPTEPTTETTSQPETPTIDTSSIENHIDIPEPEDIIDQAAPHQEKTTIQRSKRIRQPRQKREPLQQQQQQKTISQPSHPKQIPTLAQLTQGFLYQANNEGSHAIHMLGKKNSIPTDEQIKYERYLQKLNWCLQNSFNIHNDRYPSSHSSETTAQIYLALDKNGTIKHLNLVKSSGSRALDQFVLFIFRDTSSSFPPVPDYLPHDPFAITYTIMLNSCDNNIKIYRR